MGTVDETPWTRKCPRCGDTNKNKQIPITMGAPCPHCHTPIYKNPDKTDQLLYYQCFKCKQRYLTPVISKEDKEYSEFVFEEYYYPREG